MSPGAGSPLDDVISHTSQRPRGSRGSGRSRGRPHVVGARFRSERPRIIYKHLVLSPDAETGSWGEGAAGRRRQRPVVHLHHRRHHRPKLLLLKTSCCFAGGCQYRLPSLSPRTHTEMSPRTRRPFIIIWGHRHSHS